MLVTCWRLWFAASDKFPNLSNKRLFICMTEKPSVTSLRDSRTGTAYRIYARVVTRCRKSFLHLTNEALQMLTEVDYDNTTGEL